MSSKQKGSLWIFITISFYILTGYFGVYNLSMMLFWPIFALPMSLFVIKTGEKEIAALIGVMLSIIISFINTGSFHPMMVIIFLLFILAPAFVFGILYNKKVIIPHIIIATTIVYFMGLIIFLTFAKLIGIDYLETYFTILDTTQSIWTQYLSDIEVQKLLPPGEDVLETYIRLISSAILVAKRTYPATLFTISLITSTVHLLIVQLIAAFASWDRPFMKGILNVSLSPIATWVLVILWATMAQMGDVDTIWTFVIESMISILFMLFQIIGVIAIVVMIMKTGTAKIVRIMLSIISVLWLVFNPALLVVIGCMDSIFNFRKVETFI